MLEQLQALEKRYQELEHLLASYEVISDKEQYKKLSQEIEDLEIVLGGKHEEELLELARKELPGLTKRKQELEQKLKTILTASDKGLDKDAIVEIRQGTGGREAGLFAADLYRM